MKARALLLYFLGLTLLSCRPARAAENPPERDLTHEVQILKKRAQDLDLAHQRGWLLRGHWRKNLWGGFESEVGGREFFLSPKGPNHPEAELDATLEAFARPASPAPSDGTSSKTTSDKTPNKTSDKNDLQCRYLSRRNWLFQALQIDEQRFPKHACREFTDWKARLGADGLSVVFASAYLNNAASMFGHTFFKFHSRENSDDRDLLNYGVSFAAQTGGDGGVAFAWRGLLGGYRGYFSLLPYHQTLKDYTNLEGRDIYEYHLNLTQEQIDAILDHLLEIQQTYFDYYFTSRNCAYQLLWLLDIARPDLHLADQLDLFIIPADTIRILTRAHDLVGRIDYRPALMTEFDFDRTRLTSQEEHLLSQIVTAKTSSDFTTHLNELDRRIGAKDKSRERRLLETGLKFADIKAEKNSEVWQDRAYQMKLKRAALGNDMADTLNSTPSSQDTTTTTTTSSTSMSLSLSPSLSTTPPPPARPEEGPDPSELALGAGERDGSGFESLGLRLAYHNLLGDDRGYLENSHLEAMRAELRYYNQPRSLELEEWVIADLISTSPINDFFQPLSWRAKFGLQHLEDRDPDTDLAFSAHGGVGYGVSPWMHRLVIFAFVQGHLDAAPDLVRHYRLGVSAQIQAWLRLSARLRGLLGYEFRDYLLGEQKSFPGAWAGASASLSKNFELRAEASQIDRQNQMRLLTLGHFVF